VSRLAEAAAAAAVTDAGHRRRIVDTVVSERASLARHLGALDFEVVPSATNFLLVRPTRVTATALADGLRGRRILVRRYSTPALTDWLRITIGNPAELTALKSAVEELCAAPQANGAPR
jgi:histidinol-phosphate aminotransferase